MGIINKFDKRSEMESHHSQLYNQYPALKSMPAKDGKIIAEYIWIDGSGITLRSKARTLPAKVTSLADLPEWNYDGSSCYQASTDNSEVIMKPVAYFADPFRGGDNILVLTETYRWEDGTCQKLVPSNTNFRTFANQVFRRSKSKGEEPWFGIEQEFTLLGTANKFTKWPLGWPSNGYPGPQGPYYCSVGANVCFGRIISDLHYKACLAAGINISGTNAEVMPGQWEYQVGPCTGIEMGDHLMMSRYLMIRVCEAQGINVTFDPKPIPGDWNGAGCHTNYSTATMRAEGGYGEIVKAIEKLGEKHMEHIKVYGTGNERRLTGAHETAPTDKFRYGVANRGASVRIPRTTEANGCGYFEDRRPASNMDPYIVTAKLFQTTCLD